LLVGIVHNGKEERSNRMWRVVRAMMNTVVFINLVINDSSPSPINITSHVDLFYNV
jgi:hypothetical protein